MKTRDEIMKLTRDEIIEFCKQPGLTEEEAFSIGEWMAENTPPETRPGDPFWRNTLRYDKAVGHVRN